MSHTKQKSPVENGELYEHHRFIANKGQSLIRIDKFLYDKLESISRSKIQSAAQAGSILVNEKPVKPNYKVKPSDTISVVLPHPPQEFELIPENIPINIIYEDNDLLIVNKQAGMVVHPGHGNYTGTLVNALAYHLKNTPLFEHRDPRPGLVHRIDKNTSGLLVIAKTEYALSHLAKQFYDRTTRRKYVALVWGSFDEKEGTIEGNIGRDPKTRIKMHVFPDGNEGKSAITHYKLIESFGYVSLLECRLETGRTHQIRVHLAHTGHPVFNDDWYGGDKIVKGTTFSKYKQFVQNCFNIMPRQGLHAKTLEFRHPGTGKEISFESNLSEDMQTVVEKWRRYTEGRIL
ncbi:Ribosomal large subunit pseudouridine synthase D [subsurface metagenome]